MSAVVRVAGDTTVPFAPGSPRCHKVTAMDISYPLGLIRETRPYLAGAALIGGAILLHGALRDAMLIAIMLFAPMLDSYWRPPRLTRNWQNYLAWGVALLIMAGLLLLNRTLVVAWDVFSILVAAIPEEWFFRAYLLERLGRTLRGNLISTALFTLVHGLTRGPVTALLVIVPSLAYGWLYLKTRDVVLLALVHALSNLIYLLYLKTFF